jgi:hypothetical protein
MTLGDNSYLSADGSSDISLRDTGKVGITLWWWWFQLVYM